MIELGSEYFTCTMHLTVCSYHVTYAFQRKSTLYSCLNIKEVLARNRHEIWSLSDSNWTRTQNHLVRKRTLNHWEILIDSLERYWGSEVPADENNMTHNLRTRIFLDMQFLQKVTASLAFCFTPISEKSNDKILRKSPKTPFWGHFWQLLT